MGEPLARVWDRTHRRNKRRTEGTERRGQRGPRPLQHGSLTYPQFTSDYYALYTYAAFLSRLSLSLSLSSLLFSSLFVPFVFPRSRRVLPFSLAVCCSSSVPRGKLGRCPVRESRQVSIYDGTQSLDSRRYMPSSCLGHSVCPLETLAFVRIAHSMYLVLSAIGRTVYATLIKFAFRNMKWSSVGERVG